MRTSLLLLIGLATIATVAAQTAPDAKQLAAKAAADDLVHGKLTELAARFNEQTKKALPEATLKMRLGPGLAQLGAFKKYLDEPMRQTSGENEMFIYPAEFENGAVDVTIGIDGAGKVSTLLARPKVVKPPPAVSPVQEEDTIVRTRDFDLPGTISWPNGDGPFPAVVLVHGSGPNDRNETIGPNTPFRDLAWGLAQKGVAVLRYEKRTKKYGREAFDGNTTLKQEVMEDALNAVALLRGTAKIDGARIVILGHSLGGQLAPFMAKDDGKLAGIVILAGPARPVSTLLLEQLKYIQTLNPGVKALETQIADAEKLKNVTEEMAPKLFFGAPGYYWKELDSFQAVPTAKALSLPIQVLQGERDYQVSMDDFALWKSGLSGKNNVVLKSYPKLNHLFMEGQGKATPAEYQRLGHVAAYVIEDISLWIKGLPAHKL